MLDEPDRCRLSADALQRRIRENRRFHKYVRLMRRIRLRIFEYEDQGTLEQAQRVIERIKLIWGPRWERRARRLEVDVLEHLRCQLEAADAGNAQRTTG